MASAESSWVLGIDFGTSYTVAAQRVASRPAEVIDLGDERRMPSVVVVDEAGGLVVGRNADNLAAAQPMRAIRAPKSRLGDPLPVVLGGRPYQAVDLVAAILQVVYRDAVQAVGHPPADVRLTHPAAWAGARLSQLLDAATRAGIERPVLVAEPVAAAAAYAESTGIADGACVAVYDLGGGTFDSAVLQATRGGFVVIGRPGGEDRLGGNLFDEVLSNHLGGRLDPAVWEQLQVSDELAWQRAASALRAEARKVKESLSSYPTADALVTLPNGMAHVQVARAELDELIRPYLLDSVESMRRTIADAQIGPGDLQAIYLAGGASRMPLVEELVRRAFPDVAVSRRGDPKTAVALGATHQLAVTSAQPRAGGTPPSGPPAAPAFGEPTVAVPLLGGAAAAAGPVAGASPVANVDPGQLTAVVPLVDHAATASAAAAPTAAPTAAPAAVPPGSYPPGAYPPGSYPPGSFPPGSFPPGSFPPGSHPSERRRSGLVAAVIGALVAAVVLLGALVFLRPQDDDRASSTTTSSVAGSSLATTPTVVASTAPTTTAAPATAPPTTVPPTAAPAPVTVIVTVPVPVTVTSPVTNPGTGSSGGTAASCPATAANQNRSPGRETAAVLEVVTAEYLVRICWTGSEYLYYGMERANPSVSALLGAQATDSGWQASAGAFRYVVTLAGLRVYEGSSVILDQAAVSSTQFR